MPTDRPVPQLTIVIPTYNERDNIPCLISRLSEVIDALAWELIIVDDDSPDGTGPIVAELASMDSRIRLITRVGRRGLSSACMEGILAACAPLVLVMDGDLQHDESVIPVMFAEITSRDLDIVVATRNERGGGMGKGLRPHRVLLSRCGRMLGHMISRVDCSDPMSGFFLIKKSYFLHGFSELNGTGFKLLADILASNPSPAALSEIPFTFRQRLHGASKLDANVLLDYVTFVITNLL